MYNKSSFNKDVDIKRYRISGRSGQRSFTNISGTMPSKGRSISTKIYIPKSTEKINNTYDGQNRSCMLLEALKWGKYQRKAKEGISNSFGLKNVTDSLFLTGLKYTLPR